MFSVENTSLTYGLFPLSPGSLHLFLFPVPAAAFLAVTGLATLVATLCAGQTEAGRGREIFHFNSLGLLLHLCIFHIYINVTGMTTYEYVRAQRISPEPTERESSEEDERQSPSQQDLQSRCDCLSQPGRSNSNKVGPSASNEVGGVRQSGSPSVSEINVLVQG